MQEEEKLPGFFKLFWLLFMKPLAFRKAVLGAGVDFASQSSLALWREGGKSRSLVRRLAAFSLITPTVATTILLYFLHSFGYSIDFRETSLRLVAGILIGIALGVALSPVWGVGGSVAFGIIFGASGVDLGPNTLNVSTGFAWSIYRGLAWGIAASLYFDVIPSATKGAFPDTSRNVSRALFIGILQYTMLEYLGTFGADNWVAGITMGLTGLAAVFVGLFRLPIYAIEAVVQTGLYLWDDRRNPWTLHLAPVRFHELSHLPHPFLARHLVMVAGPNLTLFLDTLQACVDSPGQRRVGRAVLAELQAQELEIEAKRDGFGALSRLEGEWLSGGRGVDPLLLGFAEAARYLASAADTAIPYHRLQKLRKAQKELNALRNHLLQAKGPLARALHAGPFPVWERIVAERLKDAEAEAATQLPNPFRAKESLSPEQGREVFRGREQVIQTIEKLLGEPGRGCSIVVLGPRQTGKTSLLKMLPLFLPDAVCVFFDLQANPIDSPSNFFSALCRRAREQAKKERQLELPDLPTGPPFDAGSRWLESLDDLPSGHRVLLCIDEFERLESLFPGSRQQLLQLLGLLRATIQHRQRVRVLVAGAAPFEELENLWSDHLINAREIKIGFLDRPTTCRLLTEPIDGFPRDAIPGNIAELIFERTGGQPSLVQLYGSLLVSLLNDEKRRQARKRDIETVEEEVLRQGTYNFRYILQEAPPAAKSALIDLAYGRQPTLDRPTRQWLKRRLLLGAKDRLSVPALGAWIRQEEG